MKELIADPETIEAKELDFVQKTIKDLHSESENIKKMKLAANLLMRRNF